MSVVEAESVSRTCHILHVFRHVLPKVGTISRARTISQLDAVAPNVYLTAMVSPALEAEILHAVPATDPTIVRHGCLLFILELREVRVDNHVSALVRDLSFATFQLEVADSSLESAHGIVLETFDALHPIIVESAKQLLDLFNCSLLVLVVHNHKVVSGLGHFKMDTHAGGTSNIGSQLISQQLKVVLL